MDFSWFKNIIEKISIKFHWLKVNSPTTNTKINTNIDKQLIINQGMSPAQFCQLNESVRQIVDDRINIYRDTFVLEAKLTFNERLNDFKDLLINRTPSLNERDFEKFKEPDTQLKLLEASQISGRIKDSNQRELLANLVIRRIKKENKENQELIDIVYDEAISTINKLTINQLKIITLCFLMRYTSCNKIFSFENLDKYFQDQIKPFLDFKNTDSEFQHIVYSGCGSISIGNWDIIKIFKGNYEYLFVKPIVKSELDSIGLEPEIQRLFFSQVEKTENYILNCNSYKSMVNTIYILKLPIQNINELLLSKIEQLIKANIVNDNNIKDTIETKTKLGKQIIESITNTSLKNLMLTSVGIAIASTYYEQITSENIDITLWIN